MVQRFLDMPRPPANVPRGRDLFVRHCAACHKVGAVGGSVGPDLSGIGRRPIEVLVGDVLHPSGQVGADYFGYMVVTNDGRVLSGLLVSESPANVTLRTTEGRDVTMLRTEISEFRGTGRSLMPDGFEQALGEQGVWDVIAWLREPKAVR